jgi:hypothetical protein
MKELQSHSENSSSSDISEYLPSTESSHCSEKVMGPEVYEGKGFQNTVVWLNLVQLN